MKEQIRNVNFRPDSLAKIEQMNSIIDEYETKLTARQLYYQFVSRGLIPNSQSEYKKLTSLLTDARYAGLVDWEAIEDRGREPTVWQQYESLSDLTESALRNYRLPRWRDQDVHVELWVEKQALAGVLEPLAAEAHVTLMVNKGYSSASAMKESAERFRRACDDDQKEAVIFYLGDHDPSGKDMVRDIRERMVEFGVSDLDVRQIALTTAQVRQYNPPPNPAKITDPRARDYIAEFGPSSWEVDALPPDVLGRLIRAAFKSVIDVDKMNAVKQREASDKQRLREAVADLEDS